MTKGKKALGTDPLNWLNRQDGEGQASGDLPGSDGSAAVLVLEDDLTIGRVGELRSCLADLLQADDVSLDAGSVSVVDTAGMQLMLGFVYDRIKAGRVTNWTGVSPAFAEVAGILGLADELGLEA